MINTKEALMSAGIIAVAKAGNLIAFGQVVIFYSSDE